MKAVFQIMVARVARSPRFHEVTLSQSSGQEPSPGKPGDPGDLQQAICQVIAEPTSAHMVARVAQLTLFGVRPFGKPVLLL
jgi:hypothetical protein